MQRIGLDLLMQQCFAHGQVYVSMSRATRMSGIKIYSPATNKLMTNIVYKPILDPIDGGTNASDEERNKADLYSASDQPNVVVIDEDNIDDKEYDTNGNLVLNVDDLPNAVTDDEIQILDDFVQSVPPGTRLHSPKNNPNKTELDIFDHISDDAMDCEFVEELPIPSTSRESSKKPIPTTPRNRRRVFIRDVLGDGNCFFR